MVHVSIHHINRSLCASSSYQSATPNSSSVSSLGPPRRGELIRYAVEHLAKGSILVFVEPGTVFAIGWVIFPRRFC